MVIAIANNGFQTARKENFRLTSIKHSCSSDSNQHSAQITTHIHQDRAYWKDRTLVVQIAGISTGTSIIVNTSSLQHPICIWSPESHSSNCRLHLCHLPHRSYCKAGVRW